MVLDSQMELINLASGHIPRKESHPHGYGGLVRQLHAPFCLNCRRKSTTPILPVSRPEGEAGEALMVMDSPMELIILASGHIPRKKGHPHAYGGLVRQLHAPFCLNGRPKSQTHGLPAIWPELEAGKAPMVMDSQMQLIILASRHIPRKKSHPQGCGGLVRQLHAPFPTDEGGNWAKFAGNLVQAGGCGGP